MSRLATLVLLCAASLPLACREPAPRPLSSTIPEERVGEFPNDLLATWRAAVSAVHACGLAVPGSAVLTDEGGWIETGDLRLRVEPLEKGGALVGARFYGFPLEERERQARDLIADIARRLE